MKSKEELNKILKIAAIIFVITGIITLVIILNKGVIFGHRLVSGITGKADELHTISAIAGRNYLVEDATTELFVNIDNEDVKDGYEVKVSDESVVSVKDNVITGLKEGTAKLTIVSTKYKVECEVVVSVVVPITKLNLESEFTTIKVGEECKIKCVYEPDDASQKIEYSVSDEEIATVEKVDEKNALLKGVKKGSVTVIATDEISGKTASFTIEVK